MNLLSSGIARLFVACAVALSAFAVLPVDGGAAEQPAAQAPQSSDKVELLFVQNAVSGTFDGQTLTLAGVGPTIFFSDRPYRQAGQIQTAAFLDHWGSGSDNFNQDPPNATLSVFGKDGVDSVVVELTGPNLKGHTLSYKVKVLQGRLPASFGESSLFIDIFGRWAMFAAGTAVGRATHAVYVPPPVVVAAPAPVYTVPVAMPEPAPRTPAPVSVTVTTPGGTSASQAAAIARLKELKSLQAQGLITQAQYQEESQKLLNEIMK